MDLYRVLVKDSTGDTMDNGTGPSDKILLTDSETHDRVTLMTQEFVGENFIILLTNAMIRCPVAGSRKGCFVMIVRDSSNRETASQSMGKSSQA